MDLSCMCIQINNIVVIIQAIALYLWKKFWHNLLAEENFKKEFMSIKTY